jgi:hypothetical protein
MLGREAAATMIEWLDERRDAPQREPRAGMAELRQQMMVGFWISSFAGILATILALGHIL